MKTKAKLIELFKSLAIALLSITALILLAMATRDFFSYSENGTPAAESVEAMPLMPITPHAIVITDFSSTKESNIAHTAVKYDFLTKQLVFSQFSITLGEALGSALNESIITERDWKLALASPGILFDYLYAQPLTLIAQKLGTQISWDATEITVRRLCLARQNDMVYLYYVNESTEEIFRFETALNINSFSERLSGFGLIPSGFAFEEEDELALIEPYFIYSGERILLREVSSAVPSMSDALTETALKSFNMSIHTAKKYPDETEAIVYVEGDKMLRIENDGGIIFSAIAQDGIPVSSAGGYPTRYEGFLAASTIVSASLEPICGESEIGLIGIEESHGGRTKTYTFGYYVNGIPVRIANTGWCAKVELNGSYIMRAEFVCRSYSLLITEISPFPERYSSRISALEGGIPQLMYDDSTGVLGVNWYTVN